MITDAHESRRISKLFGRSASARVGHAFTPGRSRRQSCARVLAALVAIVVGLDVGSARAADPKPQPIRGTAAVNVALAFSLGEFGAAVVARPEGEVWVTPELAVGAWLETPAVFATGSDRCYYGGGCPRSWQSAGGSFAAHWLPVRWFDLWGRAGLGVASLDRAKNSSRPTESAIVIEARAEVGIDFHIGPILIGPSASLLAFTAINGTFVSAGGRLGANW
jgi:hypothetical protein